MNLRSSEFRCPTCSMQHVIKPAVCHICKTSLLPPKRPDLQRIPCSHCAGYGCSRCNLAGESYVMVTR